MYQVVRPWRDWPSLGGQTHSTGCRFEGDLIGKANALQNRQKLVETIGAFPKYFQGPVDFCEGGDGDSHLLRLLQVQKLLRYRAAQLGEFLLNSLQFIFQHPNNSIYPPSFQMCQQRRNNTSLYKQHLTNNSAIIHAYTCPFQ